MPSAAACVANMAQVVNFMAVLFFAQLTRIDDIFKTTNSKERGKAGQIDLFLEIAASCQTYIVQQNNHAKN